MCGERPLREARLGRGGRALLAVAVVVATLAPAPGHAGAPIVLPQGGRIAFLGDSVTWQNHYLAWLELRARQMGRGDLTFENLGVRGDTADRVRRRLERDLLPRMPDVTFIMLGVNDGGLAGVSGRLLDRYAREMSRLVAEVKARTEAPVVLLSPTCVDPTVPGNDAYNEMLRRMTQRLSGVAAEHRVPMIDVFTPLLTAVSRSGETGVPLMQDALHPNEAGHLVVAATILEALESLGSGGGHRIRVSSAVCAGGSEEVRLGVGERDRWFPPAYAPVLASAGGTAFGTSRIYLEGERCALWLRVPGRVVSVGAKVRQIDLPAFEREPWDSAFVRARASIRARWHAAYALWDPERRGTARALADVGGSSRQGQTTLEAWLRQQLTESSRTLEVLQMRGGDDAGAQRGLLSGRPISR